MIQMSVFTVVLSSEEAEHLMEVRDGLIKAGVTIDQELGDEGVLECTGPDTVIDEWYNHHLIDCIRRNFTYEAEEPSDEAELEEV